MSNDEWLVHLLREMKPFFDLPAHEREELNLFMEAHRFDCYGQAVTGICHCTCGWAGVGDFPQWLEHVEALAPDSYFVTGPRRRTEKPKNIDRTN